MDAAQDHQLEGAGDKVPVRLVGDRLYGVDYKPHELSIYGERVNFHLRWSPIADDMAESATTYRYGPEITASPDRCGRSTTRKPSNCLVGRH